MLIAIGLWWVYFDFISHHLPLPGVITVSGWMYLHLPTTMGIAAVGAAVLSVVEHTGEPLPTEVRWLLVGAVSVALRAAALLMRTIQVIPEHHPIYRLAGRVLFLSTLLILLLGLTNVSTIPLLIVLNVLLLAPRLPIPPSPGLAILPYPHLPSYPFPPDCRPLVPNYPEPCSRSIPTNECDRLASRRCLSCISCHPWFSQPETLPPFPNPHRRISQPLPRINSSLDVKRNPLVSGPDYVLGTSVRYLIHPLVESANLEIYWPQAAKLSSTGDRMLW